MKLETILGKRSLLSAAAAFAIGAGLTGCDKSSDSGGVQGSERQGLYENVQLNTRSTPDMLVSRAYEEAKKDFSEPKLKRITVGQYALSRSTKSGTMFFDVDGWDFCFQGNDKTTILHLDHTPAVIRNPESLKAMDFKDYATLEDWVVDVDEAVVVANQYGAKGGTGYFDLSMHDNGSTKKPVWTLPYFKEANTLFMVDARTGEPVGQDGRVKDYRLKAGRKSVGSGSLSDGVLEMTAKKMTLEPNISMVQHSVAAPYSFRVEYEVKNPGRSELTIHMIDFFVFDRDGRYIRVACCGSEQDKWGAYFLDPGDKFTPPAKEQGVDEQGRHYYVGYPLATLAPGDSFTMPISTGGRHFGGISKIKARAKYREGREGELMTDYLVDVKAEFDKSKDKFGIGK